MGVGLGFQSTPWWNLFHTHSPSKIMFCQLCLTYKFTSLQDIGIGCCIHFCINYYYWWNVLLSFFFHPWLVYYWVAKAWSRFQILYLTYNFGILWYYLFNFIIVWFFVPLLMGLMILRWSKLLSETYVCGFYLQPFLCFFVDT